MGGRHLDSSPDLALRDLRLALQTSLSLTLLQALPSSPRLPLPPQSPKFPQAQTEYPSKLQPFLGFLKGAVLHMATRGHCHAQSWDVLSPSGSACRASLQSLLNQSQRNAS